MTKISLIVFIALTIVGTGCTGCPYKYNRDGAGGNTAAGQQNPKSPGIVYVSEHGETLTAHFDTLADTVQVKLPDGREITLPRAISASGARYSNGGETFWEHHGEGSFLIGDKLILTGTAPMNQPTAGENE